ncbi:hypothetical protein J8273_5461 [Carpediemonas membranifera]|uniref:Vps52 C-terminal domain-containing protein n=1 Tax=Carpediemonas membranifera TaxID=201153 RepID=A0A8J6DYM4_9EUKA|nr:hypothetical protein J8273_5461 [Carpediemonas membranifera]|eukprot:KAG9392469.1 hypothetical protein J8273_5461 [Carpediemonas membranifera]
MLFPVPLEPSTMTRDGAAGRGSSKHARGGGSWIGLDMADIHRIALVPRNGMGGQYWRRGKSDDVSLALLVGHYCARSRKPVETIVTPPLTGSMSLLPLISSNSSAKSSQSFDQSSHSYEESPSLVRQASTVSMRSSDTASTGAEFPGHSLRRRVAEDPIDTAYMGTIDLLIVRLEYSRAKCPARIDTKAIVGLNSIKRTAELRIRATLENLVTQMRRGDETAKARLLELRPLEGFLEAYCQDDAVRHHYATLTGHHISAAVKRAFAKGTPAPASTPAPATLGTPAPCTPDDFSLGPAARYVRLFGAPEALCSSVGAVPPSFALGWVVVLHRWAALVRAEAPFVANFFLDSADSVFSEMLPAAARVLQGRLSRWVHGSTDAAAVLAVYAGVHAVRALLAASDVGGADRVLQAMAQSCWDRFEVLLGRHISSLAQQSPNSDRERIIAVAAQYAALQRTQLTCQLVCRSAALSAAVAMLRDAACVFLTSCGKAFTDPADRAGALSAAHEAVVAEVDDITPIEDVAQLVAYHLALRDQQLVL